MSRDSYDPSKHRLFMISVYDFNDEVLVYDVFGHDSLQSEAGVYQSCISFPHEGIMMIKHADGIALVNSFHHIDIAVKAEPSTK